MAIIISKQPKGCYFGCVILGGVTDIENVPLVLFLIGTAGPTTFVVIVVVVVLVLFFVVLLARAKSDDAFTFIVDVNNPANSRNVVEHTIIIYVRFPLIILIFVVWSIYYIL